MQLFLLHTYIDIDIEGCIIFKWIPCVKTSTLSSVTGINLSRSHRAAKSIDKDLDESIKKKVD